jgi:CheY-like chemotaxis protein
MNQNKNRVVLIVDDCEDNLYILNTLIHSDDPDTEVLEAESGEEALEIYKERQRDIDSMIVDFNMPGLNGRETICKMCESRSKHSKKDIIISIFSASCDVQDKKPFCLCDVNVVEKPISKEKLKLMLYGS